MKSSFAGNEFPIIPIITNLTILYTKNDGSDIVKPTSFDFNEDGNAIIPARRIKSTNMPVHPNVT